MHIQPLALFALLSAALAADLSAAEEPVEKKTIRTDRYGDPLPKEAVMRLGTVRFCQPHPGSLAFSPDGRFLVSGGSDNRIRLWEPDTGKELRTLEGHKSQVNCIALSADGKWLASGSQDHDLRLWEVETGKVRRQFQGHNAPIELLALSPNGKVLASSCLAGMLRLWDTDTGKEIRSLPIDKGHRVFAMTFTPDSRHFAFYNRSDKGIQLIDVATGNAIRSFHGHTAQVYGLIFTSDGATLISGGFDRTIRVWDVASGKEQRRYGDGKQMIRCLALAPDGRTLTYGTYPEGLVHIWDIIANKDLVTPWKAHTWCVASIAYSPDSKKVALGRDSIAVHETATGKRLNVAPESDSRILQIEHAPDRKRFAVWREDGIIELWDTTSWQKATMLRGKDSHFVWMAFSPNGKYLTTTEGYFDKGKYQGVIRHWDPCTGKLQKELPPQSGWLDKLAYSVDSQTLACQQPGKIVLWDAATGKERTRIPVLNTDGGMPRLSPDGRLLACGSLTKAVVLWDTKTGESLRGLGKSEPGSGGQIAFSPDGRTIATTGGEGTEGGLPIRQDIVLWETASGQERLHIAQNEGQVGAIAFSPNGRLLASVGRAETIHLWDSWTGKEIGRFTGHRGSIRSLSFAPDSKTLATGGEDTNVLIWDVSGLSPALERAAGKLSREQLENDWNDLAGMGAKTAYRIIGEWIRHPDQAESQIEAKLPTHPGMQANRLARLIAELDNDDFQTRQSASQELANLGRMAEGALRATWEGKPSAETKRRVQDLLSKLNRHQDDPVRRQLLRAIVVLERLGTPHARQLLGKLAKEATEPAVAREAQASLERLTNAEAP